MRKAKQGPTNLDLYSKMFQHFNENKTFVLKTDQYSFLKIFFI